MAAKLMPLRTRHHKLDPPQASISVKPSPWKEGNQFSEIDSELSLLGLWRWRCLAGRSVGTPRLESFLSSLEMPRTACTIWAVQAGAAVAVGVAGFNRA
jgi:hypothetical protein